MRKTLLIGSMLVFTLLLLTPSIPAVQQNTVKEGLKQEMKEKLDIINQNDLEDIKELEWIKHPILLAIVTFIYYFQFYRGAILLFFSATWVDGRPGGWELEHPLLFLRSIQLLPISDIRGHYWMMLSDIFGWNWDI